MQIFTTTPKAVAGSAAPSVNFVERLRALPPDPLPESGGGEKWGEDRFDLILIQTGANDVVGGTPYPKITRRIHKLLGIATAHARQVIHVMSGDVSTSLIIPHTMQWYFSQRYKYVREIFLQAHARHGTTYIDLYQPRSEDPFAKQPYLYYSPDGIHPSSEGYAY